MSHMQFKRHATDGAARSGELIFPRGRVPTPAFMPVGTYG
ncbi:MAG: tRNA guanosine(34) transglycosylase Tgt, partial [Thiohalospira sp.]